ncbi:MAG: ABC transporter substrate-binding protein [Verrucomicrobiia bacterium]
MNRVFKMIAVATILCGVGLMAIILIATDWSRSAVFRIKPAKTTAPAKSPSYVVSMSPMGAVRFEHEPRRIVTQDANYNDMLVAVRREEKLIATGYPSNFFDGFYAQLSGVQVSLDPQRLTYLSAAGGMFDKELLYSLRADVHHIDPLQLARSRGWSRADVEEIARNVGPFFANRYSRENSYPGHEPYEYYTAWELADKVAQVYRQPQRIARLKEVYDKMVHDIAARLPPPDKRPRIGLVFYSKGRFTPYSLTRGGFGQAQYRDVGARDAFAEIQATTYGGSGGTGVALDVEGLLALNPDVLIVPFAIYPASQSATSRSSYEELLKLKNDSLAQRLTAFRKAQVYPGGTPLQGPIFYLFQIEMAAKQIYPDIFGPYRNDQQYPLQEQLFDRVRVANILKGEAGEEHGHP